MYIPRGAQIIPNHGLPIGVSSGGGGWPERIQIVLDRRVLAEVTREELQGVARRNGTAAIR